MHATPANLTVNLARLKWLCRRGMLELDLLLEQFLARYGAQLSVSEQIIMEELLLANDHDLLAWILQQQPVEDEKFIPLLIKIREYRHCQFI